MSIVEAGAGLALTALLVLLFVLYRLDRQWKREQAEQLARLEEAVREDEESRWPRLAYEDFTESDELEPFRPHTECVNRWADGEPHRVHARCRDAIVSARGW